jgi:hypothetical protein
MDTEQPATDSDIHDRLVASFTPEQETTEEAPQEAPQVEETGEETELIETAEAPELVDFADDDGTVHKIPKALEGKIPLRAEFTRKTQEAARLAEVAQDRLHFAEVRERFNEAFAQKGGEVQALEHQLKQLENLNPAIYGGDQTALWQHFQNVNQLKAAVDAGKKELETWKGQFGNVAKQHSERQWSLAVNGAKERIGAFTPGEDAAMAKQVQALGFTDAEIKGRFADPRVLHAVYKAAKYDTLMAQKGKALEAASKAPPVVKPGVSKGPGAGADQKYREVRSQLKSSGSLKDAARLFLLRGK